MNVQNKTHLELEDWQCLAADKGSSAPAEKWPLPEDFSSINCDPRESVESSRLKVAISTGC
jgi:hypothetical protein